MVGFNPPTGRPCCRAQTYLHSIMVGFNPCRAHQRRDLLSIYIPLWSDSILTLSLCRSRRPYLHSIMVGFNRELAVSNYFGKYIYIPLWSDSIRIEFSEYGSSCHIYIPLWSDSIRRELPAEEGV